ncbi:hypothetical protein Bcav_0830 [Beutenbergia cavernae DSM 12333]|uniref:Lipoprotein n=1 Tax=Beutenbergia cavernae (strain ATCC BAA-8 / DSM 12333 / CCUG 43141 / JCM 11478 / NBRC 16432 / NCIMB 13614 / HKI 0122) TaxID=471853 RepID=C5BZB9_BEUC1|nr:hypothetical protein [Beutenbergia cavernae]ACQ79091.1 hypothetical protein Bcav_0830 [Beutenbergia cavernae DSM 12333]
MARRALAAAAAALAVLVLASCSQGTATVEPGAGSPPSPTPTPAQDATPSSPDALSLEWIADLEDNRAELTARQDAERAEAATVLQLPPGAAWGNLESFQSLDDQILALETGTLVASEDSYPELLWYEDGFFASLMAIDWRCAWLSTAVQRAEAGDVAGAANAVGVLRSFSSTSYVASFPDYDRVFLADYVDPVLDGSTQDARELLGACPAETLVH